MPELTDDEKELLSQIHVYVECYRQGHEDTVGHPNLQKNMELFEALLVKLDVM